MAREMTEQSTDPSPKLTKEGRPYRRRVAVYLCQDTLDALTRWNTQERPGCVDFPISSRAITYALDTFFGCTGVSGATGYGTAWKKVEGAPARPTPKRETAMTRRSNPMGLHVVKAEEGIHSGESTPEPAATAFNSPT